MCAAYAGRLGVNSDDVQFPVPAAVLSGSATWSAALGTNTEREATAALETARQQQMVEEVKAMGFDEETTRNALEATAWTSVEVVIGVLLG